MDDIKNCFLHGRYEGDECIGCAFMRKERGTDKDDELRALRAEVAKLREALTRLGYQYDSDMLFEQIEANGDRQAEELEQENERLRKTIQSALDMFPSRVACFDDMPFAQATYNILLAALDSAKGGET